MVIPKQNCQPSETVSSKKIIAEKVQCNDNDEGLVEDVSEKKTENVKFLGYLLLPKGKDAVSSDISQLQLLKQSVDEITQFMKGSTTRRSGCRNGDDDVTDAQYEDDDYLSLYDRE